MHTAELNGGATEHEKTNCEIEEIAETAEGYGATTTCSIDDRRNTD